MVMRISWANSLWVFADTLLENCTGVPYETQYVDSLVVDVNVRYKPLLKASELLLFLFRHDDIPLRIPRSVWRWSR
jgi:hypothetical protein